MAALSKRELLIEAAIELFAKQGFHATGIAAILAKAGVSKKTLYHYFHSKEELVLAALRHHDSLFRNFFMREVKKQAQIPRAQLLAVFDVAEAWFLDQNFYGCIFINAVGEYSSAPSPVREVSKEFKRLMRGFIEEICCELGVAEPEQLAESIALLLEGAIVTAQVSGHSQIAQSAKRTAGIVIDQALVAARPGKTAWVYR